MYQRLRVTDTLQSYHALSRRPGTLAVTRLQSNSMLRGFTENGLKMMTL